MPEIEGDTEDHEDHEDSEDHEDHVDPEDHADHEDHEDPHEQERSGVREEVRGGTQGQGDGFQRDKSHNFHGEAALTCLI